MLERGGSIAHTWTRLYDSLVLHTGKHLSALPGLPFPASTPLFPSRTDFLGYLDRYTSTFQLPVTCGADVTSVRRDGDSWSIALGDGRSLMTRAVVIATGIASTPYAPEFANRPRFTGRVIHSIEYQRPQPFAGQLVLVVGAGNSSGEISAELADAGAHVTVSIRSGVRVVPRQIFGVPIQYVGVALRHVPQQWLVRIMSVTGGLANWIRGGPALPPAVDSSCPTVPLIGFHLVDGVKNGRIQLASGVSEFTRDGMRFRDGSEQRFDTVILATGFRATLDMLGPEITRDPCGFANRRDRVVSAEAPGLYFVGHNFDVAGALRNIAQDAHLTARFIAVQLNGSGRRHTEMRPRRNGR